MSQHELDANPVRRRAGLLSALVKNYVNVKKLIENDGSAEDGIQLQEKLNEQYVKYLDSHEVSLTTYPDREENLMASHVKYELRHQHMMDDLAAYIADGTKPREEDLESLHAESLFSLRSKKSVARSQASRANSRKTASKAGDENTSQHPPSQGDQRSGSHHSHYQSVHDAASHVSEARSERLSEARIQAELAQKRLEQEELLQQANRLKITMEREAAQQKQILDAEAEQLASRRRELEEETERRALELEQAIQLQRKRHDVEALHTEVNARKAEEMRATLGSDYNSDEERDDVTSPRPATRGFQPIDEQSACLTKVLEEITRKQAESRPGGSREQVKSWLQDASRHYDTPPPQVPLNTPAVLQTGYKPQSQQYRPLLNAPPIQTQSKPFDINDANTASAALLGQALLHNRLPKPEILTFDGDSKRYKIFMASFLTNVSKMLGDDEEMKLTLLLQHCKGKAHDLIEDCVMLPPSQGYSKALEKLEKRFGQSHQIARSYIDGVTTGSVIKQHNVEAIVQLADDMEKCQTVLSALHFTSDLNAIDTLRSIIRRLPDSIRLKWVERSIKIADEGRDATFADLTKFMVERARVYSSIHGKDFAEDKTASTKPRQQQDSGHGKPHQRKRNVTTLATAVSSESSTAGQSEATTSCAATSASVPQTSDTKRPVCLQCEKIGHYLPRCTKFKRLSLEDKRAAVKKLNLCFCCLRPGHGSADCDKKCPKCEKKHHYHLHEDRVDAKPSEDTKTAAAGVVASSTFKDRGRASLGVLHVRVRSNGKEAMCWALVDSGSNTTFIKRSIADELNLTGPDHIFSVNTLGGTTSHDEKCVDFVLVSEDGKQRVYM